MYVLTMAVDLNHHIFTRILSLSCSMVACLAAAAAAAASSGGTGDKSSGDGEEAELYM